MPSAPRPEPAPQARGGGVHGVHKLPVVGELRAGFLAWQLVVQVQLVVRVDRAQARAEHALQDVVLVLQLAAPGLHHHVLREGPRALGPGGEHLLPHHRVPPEVARHRHDAPLEPALQRGAVPEPVGLHEGLHVRVGQPAGGRDLVAAHVQERVGKDVGDFGEERGHGHDADYRPWVDVNRPERPDLVAHRPG